MPIIVIKEHELREKHGHENWQSVLKELSDASDIFLHYACVESDATVNDLLTFAKEFDGQLNVVVFEECVEKGGGGELGLIPSLGEYIFRGSVFVFGAVAVGFLQEMGEDAYSKWAKIFGKYRAKMHARGSLSVTLKKGDASEYTYYYPKSLTAEQAIEGFRAVRKHFSDNESHMFENRFVYVAKLGEWERL
jgi:hypothetical protein